MGLFDFLKKKGEMRDADDARRGTGTRGAAGLVAGPVTRMALDTDAERARQREIARATAAKIDAIELAMTSDIFDDDSWGGNRRAPAAAALAAAPAAPVEDVDLPFAPDDVPDAAAAPSSAPTLEEAVILYANDQLDAAALVLRASLADAGASERLPWWMLFDLYQIMGREDAFDSVAIDYASRFETSPPAYVAVAAAGSAPAGPASGRQFAGVMPTAQLSGRLDDGAAAALARATAPSSSPLVRFEFQAVTEVAPAGCALLLDALQAVRKSGRELVLAGPDHLVALLRPMLAIGERGPGPAPWLLLLELLLLTQREKDFEETAMDYCVTFEVSPPSFETLAKPAAREAPARAGASAGDRFLLPGALRADAAALLADIAAHAARAPDAPIVLDASRLAQLDYGAAAALAAQLRTLAQDGRDVELRDLNHLAAALLRLLGSGERVRLYTRKY